MKKINILLIVLGIVVIVLGVFMLVNDQPKGINDNNQIIIQAGEVYDVARSAKVISIIRMSSPQSSLFKAALDNDSNVYNDNGRAAALEDVERGDFVVVVGTGDGEGMIVDKVLYREKEKPSFSRVGNVSVNAPGNEENIPYLLYEEEGAPANSLRMVFADFSVCDFGNNSDSCSEIKNTPDIFSGEKVEVYGERDGSSLYVLYIRSLESDGGVVDSDDRVQVDWELAKSYIRDCKVKQVSQLHNKEIHLDLKDGRVLKTTEPELDIVFDFVQDYTDKCGNIIMATE